MHACNVIALSSYNNCNDIIAYVFWNLQKFGRKLPNFLQFPKQIGQLETLVDKDV